MKEFLPFSVIGERVCLRDTFGRISLFVANRHELSFSMTETFQTSFCVNEYYRVICIARSRALFVSTRLRSQFFLVSMCCLLGLPRSEPSRVCRREICFGKKKTNTIRSCVPKLGLKEVIALYKIPSTFHETKNSADLIFQHTPRNSLSSLSSFQLQY